MAPLKPLLTFIGNRCRDFIRIVQRHAMIGFIQHFLQVSAIAFGMTQHVFNNGLIGFLAITTRKTRILILEPF